jgi:cation diffusion facilitator CzcD-associated flavoprotein CzcO
VTDPKIEQAIKANYPTIRQKERESPLGLPDELPSRSAFDVSPEERERIYEKSWQAGGFRLLVDGFKDVMTSREANRTLAEFIARKIRSEVRDPVVAEKLVPHYPFGAKRPALDTDYFATYNRDNVALVDLRDDPIEAITPRGVRTRTAEHRLDSIIFATGFDAFTGSLYRMNIRGRGGMRLEDHWANGPRTVLGFASHNFPNLFMIGGPQSGVYFNVARNIEQHVDWIADCIQYMRQNEHVTIEPNNMGEESWGARVKEAADATFIPETDSWWVGANIPGKPRVILRYIGGAVAYRNACTEVAAKGYEGFTFG